MHICYLGIRHFKSIKELFIQNIEQAMILVGKNSTGKTVVLDAILAVVGKYNITASDFHSEGNRIEIEMKLSFLEEDLKAFWNQGAVSKYKRYELWYKDFCSKLPSYKDGMISFTFFATRDGKIRYDDGIRKNNHYIRQILPQVYYIDHGRRIEEIQRDIFEVQGGKQLKDLREGRCMFDRAKECISCFSCIGMIQKKTPEELTIAETERLLDYKLCHLNMDRFIKKLNSHFKHNAERLGEIQLHRKIRIGEAFSLDTKMYNKEQKISLPTTQLSEGMRSIYVLSLLETYAEETPSIPSIMLIEDPEIFLHPQLQKTAGEILYRLSRKNQVIFSTHAPAMIFNFNTKQIKQIYLDKEGYTSVKEDCDIDEILNNLGYSANDLMNVSFVFIVEGKQDSSRLPLLLEKYYEEISENGEQLKRIAIIPTNSCTNIKTYANLKYINKLYLKDQFLMIRDSDGKDPDYLKKQLCGYYKEREYQDKGNLPRVQLRNVLILKYYSFENYFLDPEVMCKIGVVPSVDAFYDTLFLKFKEYLYKLTSVKKMTEKTGIQIKTRDDVIKYMEEIRIYVRGHNLYDIFYGRYKGDKEEKILRAYIDAAPRDTFKDILDTIDSFVYFENRKRG